MTGYTVKAKMCVLEYARVISACLYLFDDD